MQGPLANEQGILQQKLKGEIVMKFEKAKKFLKKNAVRILCAGMIMTGAAVAVMPSSFAAVTQKEMDMEVPMYDPSDKSFFLVKDRNTADYCEKTMGYKRITFASFDSQQTPVFMTQRMTPDQAKYKAKFAYMAAGYDDATATALVNAMAKNYEASPDNWWKIAYTDIGMYLHAAHCPSLEETEALEKKLTGTVMTGTHQGIMWHENDDETAGAVATTSGKKAGSAAEEVNQLYASLVTSGKTSDQAMAEVNAQLASIIAKYAK